MKKIVRFLYRWIAHRCQKCGGPTLRKESIYAGLCPKCDNVRLYERSKK